MAKKILNVVTQGHRATLEEQDDPVLWLTAVLKANGSDVAVLLRGSGVGVAVKGQDASGLAFGAKAQTQPPKLDEDIARLVAKGVAVRYVTEDARERGIVQAEIVEGVTAIGRAEIPALFAGFDQVWAW